MNIKGVNLLSLAPGNSAIEGGAQPLLENGAIPDGFSNALMGQIGLLSELPGQLKSRDAISRVSTMSQTLDNSPGDEEELAALFGNYLPVPYKKNETDDLEATLLTLTDALKSITPSSAPDEMATAQNMSSVTALNGPFFVKPLPEEAKLNKLGEENVASGDVLQKETVLRQSIQDEQGFNLQSLENAESAEKTRGIEKQASLSGIEKTAPGIAADIVPIHSPVDNKTDSPAITRPLTHPGWSRDLGEQIVWMNNKAISAAEIKLNPAHLGPISVRIDVNQDQATIAFTAQHVEVKEAIEASIPKLREMLGAQQLNLVNVNISQNSTSDQGQSQAFYKTPENHEQGIDGVTDALEKSEHDRVVVSKGLLSIYA
jgi:flagellar hook-length control protein FliK